MKSDVGFSENPVPSYELAEDLLSVQKQPQLSPSEAARIGDVYGMPNTYL